MVSRFFRSVGDGFVTFGKSMERGLENIANFNMPKIPIISHVVAAVDRNVVKTVDTLGNTVNRVSTGVGNVVDAGTGFASNVFQALNPQNLLLIGGIVVVIMVLR